MSITINIYYSGQNGNARKFAEEMKKSKIVSEIQNEDGNEKYQYFFSMDDPETILLIDRWKNREALDFHHKSPLMDQIAKLREKYDLHMTVERYISDEQLPADVEEKYIRK